MLVLLSIKKFFYSCVFIKEIFNVFAFVIYHSEKLHNLFYFMKCVENSYTLVNNSITRKSFFGYISFFITSQIFQQSIAVFLKNPHYIIFIIGHGRKFIEIGGQYPFCGF